MIQIVMKPDYDVKPESRKNCYKCLFNGEDVGFRVWGQRASNAEEKLMEIFRINLKGKEVDYDLEAYRKSKREGCDEKHEDGKEGRQEKDEREDAPLLPGMG